MLALSVALFFLACLGHAALFFAPINWLYSTRFRGFWIPFLRHVFQLLILAGPPLFLAYFGEFLWRTGDWPALPAAVRGYLLLCWCVAVVILLNTARRWRQGEPDLALANHSVMVDYAHELGRKPYGTGGGQLLARMPWNEIFQVEFSEKTLAHPRLPAGWDELAILHLTDLHLCGVPDLVFFERVMDRIAAWPPPDLLALTGDILDSDQHYHWIKPVLGRLRWRDGAFAILGNHDAWLDVPRIKRELAALRIQHIGGNWRVCNVRGLELVIAGHEGPWLPPSPNLDGCPAGPFRLCLCHTPDAMPWAREKGMDLVLAGHNHGGQIRFPFLGPALVPSRYGRRYDCGVFWEPPTLLHVGRGLGGTHPLRYRCRPEVTLIRLRPAAHLDDNPA